MTNNSNWIKDNLFSIANLLLILATFTYQYGISTAKLAASEAKMEVMQKVVNDMTTNGHPPTEARVTALEKKTDDLAVLKNIVSTQADNIAKLTDLVRSDHDILIRISLQQK